MDIYPDITFDLLTSLPPNTTSTNTFEIACDRCHLHYVSVGRKNIFGARMIEMIRYISGAIWYVIWKLPKHKYALIHCHFLLPTGIVALLYSWMRGFPYIVTVHGSDVPGYNPDKFTVLHRCTRPVIRLIARHATTLVFPSQYLSDLFSEQVGSMFDAKKQVIPNGIDVSAYTPKEKQDYCLTAGRLVERKGFIPAAQAVVDTSVCMPLRIVGDGPLWRQLNDIANMSNKKITMIGWIDNTSTQYHSLFAHASIFVLDSPQENMSMVLLEALASGCAVIVASGGGNKDVVGESGIFVEAHNVAALSDALALLSTNDSLRHTYQQVARDRALELFDIQRVSRLYKELYDVSIVNTYL
jgi:glycosyltransferase involved in cell wall biosynthesis